VAVSACCQCGRNRLMSVHAVDSLGGALSASGACDAKWILDPEAASGLPPAAAEGRVAIAVGPEGGFDRGEIEQAARAGFVPMRLGARVLRTETAGITAAAACLALSGEYSRAGD
jgi:16S rRNA (uracil1498-N3)-methyltransferase